jgi:hypothetical protein
MVRIEFDFDPTRVNMRSEWSEKNLSIQVVTTRYREIAGTTEDPNLCVFEYLKLSAEREFSHGTWRIPT